MNQHEVRDIRRMRVWKEQFFKGLFQGQSESEKRQNTNVFSQRQRRREGDGKAWVGKVTKQLGCRKRLKL
jgi:hypothetical protein